MSDISGNDCNCAEIETLVAEVERLKGLKAELPPFPPSGNGLPRFGLRWNGPTQPLAVPMGDGYWTPFHLAAAQVATLTAERDALKAGAIEVDRLVKEELAASLADLRRVVAERDAARAQLDHARFDGANGERARLLAEIDRLRTKYAQECREEEREACAKVADAHAASCRKFPGTDNGAEERGCLEVAAAIRARGLSR